MAKNSGHQVLEYRNLHSPLFRNHSYKKTDFFSALHRPFDCKLHKEKSVCTLDWNDGQIFEMMQGVQKGPSGAKHGRLAYVLKGAKRVQKDPK